MEGCKAVRRLFVSIVVLVALFGGATLWWLNQSLVLSADALDLDCLLYTSDAADE